MRLPGSRPVVGVDGVREVQVELRDSLSHCFSVASVSGRRVCKVFIDRAVAQSSVCVVRMINSTCELLVDVLINHFSATNVESSSAFSA